VKGISKPCPKCGNDVAAAIAAGVAACPVCGDSFGTSSTPPVSPRRGRLWLFWTMLIGPTVLILLMLGLMRAGANQDDVGLVFGVPGFFSGIIGSFYCGVWLARRIATRTWLRATLAIVLTSGLLVVNYSISVVGCMVIPESL